MRLNLMEKFRSVLHAPSRSLDACKIPMKHLDTAFEPFLCCVSYRMASCPLSLLRRLQNSYEYPNATYEPFLCCSVFPWDYINIPIQLMSFSYSCIFHLLYYTENYAKTQNLTVSPCKPLVAIDGSSCDRRDDGQNIVRSKINGH